MIALGLEYILYLFRDLGIAKIIFTVRLNALEMQPKLFYMYCSKLRRCFCVSLAYYIFCAGQGVSVVSEKMVLNSIVLPHKELGNSYKNQIIL